MKYNTEISKEFWKNQTIYPNYGFIKQRRFYEIEYIIKNINSINNIDSFTDIGCGDGALIKCLDNLLDIKHINCLDWSMNLMSNIELNNRISKIQIDLSDLNELNKIPINSTIYNLGGVISFIFDDNMLYSLLQYLSQQEYKYLFLRSPCSISGENLLINTYSNKLQENYSSLYRTVDCIIDIFKNCNLNIKNHIRIYPDSIESDHGTTKQYMFFIENDK